MHWWPAFFGTFLLVWAIGFAFMLRSPMSITTTDLRGNQKTEYRRLRPGGQLLLAGGILLATAFGCCLLAGAIPWIDERVPDERLLPLLAVGLTTAALGGSAIGAWVWAWRSRGHPIVPAVEAESEDGPDELFVGAVARLLMSHPVGATLLGAVWMGLAVFSATQLPAAWRGNEDRLDGVLKWLQPLHALGSLLGLSTVTVALILLGIWLVVALFTGNELGAVLTVLLLAGYGVVALIAWPFGLGDEWLGLGRSVLSLL
jgi:hypothetical protein